MSKIGKLPLRDLRARLEQSQKQAFSIFEHAAERAQADPRRADAIYLQANDQAKPVLANAESLRQEFVRRMRRRAARAWWVAIGAGAVGVIAAVWLTLR